MRNEFMSLATFEAPSEIMSKGGTGMWRVKPASVHNTDYVVICARPKNPAAKEEPNIEPFSAFLIGKISGVMGLEGRYRIMVNKVAALSIPGAWEKGSRFPFLYSLTPALEGKIDLENLEWCDVPAGSFA